MTGSQDPPKPDLGTPSLGIEVARALAAIDAVQERILDALLPGPPWRLSALIEAEEGIREVPGADGAPGLRLCHPSHAARLIAAALDPAADVP
jgi:hypothetical protein